MRQNGSVNFYYFLVGEQNFLRSHNGLAISSFSETLTWDYFPYSVVVRLNVQANLLVARESSKDHRCDWSTVQI